MIGGIEIKVSADLVGSKVAVRFGDGPLILSPAMHDLVAHADADELHRLLGAIRVLQLPAMPCVPVLGMTTEPPPAPTDLERIKNLIRFHLPPYG